MPPLSSVLFWPCLTLAFLLCLNGTTNFFVQANNLETAGERVMAEVEVDVSSGSTITGDDIPVMPSDMPHAEMLASMAARFGDPSKGEGVKITKLVCEDNNEQCSELADAGECKTNPSYMNLNCRKSCELCAGQERVNPKLRLMELSQGSDMGAEQDFVDKDWPKVSAEQTSEAIKKAREYLANDTKNIDSEIMKLCRNQHSQCTIWALYGECDKNPGMMKKSCAPACHSCHFLSIEGRCPIDDDTALHIWKPGDLDAMFEKLTSEPYAAQYETQVLASPEGDKDGDNSNTMNRPWVITLENIITEEEALKLIELGAVEGYKRSSDVGRLRADGSHESSINSGRTSTNSWCLNQCYQDPTVQTVVQRLSNITGIPEINSEYLQLLRYEPEQYYQVHHGTFLLFTYPLQIYAFSHSSPLF